MENIAGVYYSQGNHTKSLEYAENAAKLAVENGYSNTYWLALTTIAKMRLASGKKKEAKQALESAINTIEILRKQIAGGEHEQQIFFEDKTAPYYLMVELLISQDNVSEAFSYAERAKSRTLLDVLQNGKFSFTKAMTVQEKEQERQFKDELVSLNAQTSKENERQQPDKVRLADLNNQLEKKRLEFEDFQIRLYAAHPELKVQRGEMKPISLEEAGNLLPDNQSALLEYVVADDKTFLFVLTKDGKQTQSGVSLKVYPINIKQKDLAEKVENFRSKLAKGDLDFAPFAQDLYNLLLKPAEAQIKNKTNLTIVPDSVLWDLPFQALQTNQNRYLIEQTALSYAPSLTALREMTKKTKKINSNSNLELLAFGNPLIGKETKERIKQVFMSESLEPIPEAERLVNTLGKLYGANRSKIYTGRKQMKSKLKRTLPNTASSSLQHTEY
jgi:CHAT domain-containing protein